MKRFAMLLALVIHAPAQAQSAAQDVIDCMRANVPSAPRVQTLELVVTDRTGGTRSIKGKLYGMLEKTPAGGGLVRAMLRIDSPVSLAGAAYLVREAADSAEEMFVYLPSVGRVRRIASSSADRSLLGTDFSYSDFKLLSNAFVGSAVKLEAPSDVVQRQAYRITFTPLAGGASPYSFVRTWVDKETCVPLKAYFYVGDTVRKRFTAPLSALQQAGKYWYLSEVVMRDLLTGTQTVMTTGQVTDVKETPGRYFDPELFYRSH
jgi:hypothetical protein